MKISAIAAVSDNYVIGKDNGLLWHLPLDMKFFRETTSGHHVITGRKNYLSIPERFRPLPNRVNIVVTRQNIVFNNCIMANSIEEAIAVAEQRGEAEVFIIGGGEIYQQTITNQLVDRIYITWVRHDFEGDTFFPELDFSKWQEISRVDYEPDEKNVYATSFCIYEKNN